MSGDGTALRIEESPEGMRVEWPVRGGEFRRKLAVGLQALFMVWPPVLYLGAPPLARAFGKMVTLPHLGPLLPAYLLLLALVVATVLLPLARVPGHGLLVLEGDRILLSLGGGRQVLRARRGSLKGVLREGSDRIRVVFVQDSRTRVGLLLRSGIGYWYTRRGLSVALPGPREADWMAEALGKWLRGA